MNLFTKPCGCRGTGLLQSTRGSFTLRKKWKEQPEEKPENRNPLDDYNGAPCGIALRGQYPTYSSTELIEIQAEKEIEERQGFTVEKEVHYFLYGCLKCGETWKEHYKTDVKRDWKE